MRERAIAALLETNTITAAAQLTGIAEKSLRNWLKEPGFAGEYRDARRALVTQASDRLAKSCREAVDTLNDIMRHSENDAPRVTAARAILDYAYKAVEIDDLTARLERLEAQLNPREA
jgi:arginine/lysine/ornithine decarboxylase